MQSRITFDTQLKIALKSPLNNTIEKRSNEIQKYRFFLQLRMRHLLRVSGVSSFVYWFELLISDGVVFILPVVLMLILIPAFELPSLSPAPAMGALVLAVLLYLPSGILFSYLLSFIFSAWEVAQQVLPNVFTFVSTIGSCRGNSCNVCYRKVSEE